MAIIAMLLHILSSHLEDRVLAHDGSMPLCTLAVLAASVLVGWYGHDYRLLAVHASPLHRKQRMQHLASLFFSRIHHFHLFVRHSACSTLQPIVHVKSHVRTYVYVQSHSTNPPWLLPESTSPSHNTRKTAITFQIHVNKHNKNRAIINLNRIF